MRIKETAAPCRGGCFLFRMPMSGQLKPVGFARFVFLWFSVPLAGFGSFQVVSMDSGGRNSSFSHYGTCPESPDGKYLSFVTYEDPAGNPDSVVRFAAVAQIEINCAVGSPVLFDATPNYLDGKEPANTLISSGQWVATERNEWVCYDLGAVTEIRSVDIKWAGDFSRSYLFTVAVNDLSNAGWQTVYEGRAGTSRTDFETFDFPDVSGRYVRLTLNGWKSPCELWICDRDRLTNLRKLHDFDSGAHNGGEAVWINNSTLAFQAEPNGEINVVDVESTEMLLEFTYGKLGANSWSNRLAYAVNVLEKSNWQTITGQTVEQGVYVWDLNTENTVQICTSSNLASQLIAAGASDVPAEPKLSHLQFSPDGSRVSFRWDGLTDEHLAIVSTNGTLISAFPDPKPLHFLWYDSDTVMGVEVYPNTYNNRNYKR